MLIRKTGHKSVVEGEIRVDGTRCLSTDSLTGLNLTSLRR